MRTLLLAGTALLASALIAPAASATVTPGTVTVDRDVRQSSDLQLLGVSDQGVIASRDGSGVVAGALTGTPTVFGDPGLADYGAAYHPPADGSRVSDLSGSIIRWAEPKGSAWVVHRQGAFDGLGQKDYDSPDQPLAFTPDSWIGYAGGTLKKHVFGGSTTTLLTGLTGVSEVRADAQLSGELPTAISLTPNSVVWFAEYQPVNILGVVHRRARPGGAISSVDAPQAARAGEELAATDTTIAVTRRQRYRTDVGETSVRLYALRGSSPTWQGDRLAARVEDGTYANRELDTRLLTDSGTYLTHLAEKPTIEAPIKNSGDYLLQNHKVYRGDSLTPVLDLSSRKCRGEDLFGSLVVCNQPDGKNSVVDVTGRFPSGTTSGTGTGPVAIWGTTVAWVSSSAQISGPTQISIQDLGVAGSLKTVAAPGRVRDLRLGEGVIGWTDEDGDLMVADRHERHRRLREPHLLVNLTY